MVNKIIVALRFGEEIIGCYSLLSKKLIDEVIFLTNNNTQLIEVEKSSKIFDFKYKIIEIDKLEKNLKSKTLIYTPHPYNHNPIYSTITSIIQKFKYPMNYEINYYSIDMNIPQVKLLENWQEKRKILYDIYPSQSKYFDNNPHLYMFEGITEHPSTPYIAVTTTIYAYHRYPESNRPFIKVMHPHIFFIKVMIGVEHLNRQIEFYDLREEINKILRPNYDTMSCEAIAKEVYYYIKHVYQSTKYIPIRVEVYEDPYQYASYGDVL
jgi:hypothetical protein